MKNSAPKLSVIFTASAMCLLAGQNAACVAPPSDDLAGAAAETDKAATYFEDWMLAGYDDAGRLEDYCADVGNAPPRITAMYVDEYGDETTHPPVFIEIVGCTDGKYSFLASISGEMEAFGNGFCVLGTAYAESYAYDGSVETADKDMVFTFSYTESNKQCQPQGDLYLETATRDIALQAPTSDYQTAALLAQVQPSTLQGLRAVNGCY